MPTSRRAVLPCALAVLSLGACSASGRPEAARVAVAMKAPAGLLDAVDAVRLTVDPEAQVKCDEAKGLSDKPYLGSVASLALKGPGCPQGARWCGDLDLPLDASRRLVFGIEATKGAAKIAVGCKATVVASSPAQVAIQVRKFVKPNVCGNEQIEVGEECDLKAEADTPVCGADCHARELLLSNDNKGILNDPKDSKSHVSLVWQNDPANVNPNPLRAVFDDTTGVSGTDINYTVLSSAMLYVEAPKAIAGGQVRLPSKGGARSLAQEKPVIAALDDGTFMVAFEDARSAGGVITAVPLLDTSAPLADVIGVNASGGGAVQAPAIAGLPSPGSKRALVVWTDTAAQRVMGRIVSSAGTLSPAADIKVSSKPGSAARVAASKNGWAVVWRGAGDKDGDDVALAAVTPDGQVVQERTVNEKAGEVEDQPDVAVLPDGAFAVVWHAATDVWMQRFDAAANPIAGDQKAPLNDVGRDGDQSAPAVAAGTAGSFSFYAVVWLNGTDGSIRIRYPSEAAGFLYGWTTGQNGESVASASRPGQRMAPAVAVGGGKDGTSWVAVAWDDRSDAQYGIFARRLPVPSAQ